MAANPERRYTLEEYLELDRTSEERLEFWDGEVFCMSGGSEWHYEIESNIHSFLKTTLRARGCRVFTGNVRIKVPSAPPYRYADVSALCGGAEFEEAYIDLRAFVLPAAGYIMPGGLTRVASTGTRVVNSSAGGSFKDTWVLED